MGEDQGASDAASPKFSEAHNSVSRNWENLYRAVAIHLSAGSVGSYRRNLKCRLWGANRKWLSVANTAAVDPEPT